ncbi:GtrA family protein [Microbispora hainanensis]|uniref:GtrA family protein n=1 Tax=Microbispora hainanensis TaxID=568844 RepID=A0A544Z5W2_9ACTN|nr:GtrA family protein [Microbispora hainanensis]TQS24022.1 GtrA family protein [Microbispora hainanensis]
MQLLRRAYERFAALIHELIKFGLVGAIAFVIDFGGTNLLRFGVGMGPLSSKVVATIVAATFAYAGNRFWTYRHREQSGLAREYVLFFLLNGIGLLPPLLTIGFVSYSLGLHDAVSYNIAQFIGVGLGTLFRFWSYKKWVFLAVPELAPTEEPAEGAVEKVGALPHSDVRPHSDVKAQPDPLTTS